MPGVVVRRFGEVEHHAGSRTLELVRERLVVAMNTLHEGAQEAHRVRGEALSEEVSVVGLLHALPRASGVTARRTLRTLELAGTTVARSGYATAQPRKPPLPL